MKITLFWFMFGILSAAIGVSDPQSQQALPEFGVVDRIASSGDGNILAVTYLDNDLSSYVDLFDAVTGRWLQRLTIDALQLPLISLNPDGSRLAYTGQRGDLFILEIATGSVITIFLIEPGEQREVEAIAWSPINDHLAWSNNAALKISDGRTGEWLAGGGQMDSQLTGIIWSPDGNQIITLSLRGNGMGEWTEDTRLWDVATFFSDNPNVLIDFDDLGFKGATARWHPDGHQILLQQSTRLVLFDLETRQVLVEILQTEDERGPISWSPDGSQLAKGSGNIVQIWNTSTWEVVEEFQGTRPISRTVWSPDGNHVYSNLGTEGLYRDDVPVSQLHSRQTPIAGT